MRAYCVDGDTCPAPGSDKAREQGCTCPVIDNQCGKGRGGDGEKYGWYISGGCSLHSGQSKEDRGETGDGD